MQQAIHQGQGQDLTRSLVPRLISFRRSERRLLGVRCCKNMRTCACHMLHEQTCTLTFTQNIALVRCLRLNSYARVTTNSVMYTVNYNTSRCVQDSTTSTVSGVYTYHRCPTGVLYMYTKQVQCYTQQVQVRSHTSPTFSVRLQTIVSHEVGFISRWTAVLTEGDLWR